jgi:hypothetical protein
MTEWKKIEPKFWKPEKVDDEVSGVLVGKEENVGKFKSMVYHIERNGEQFNLFGSTVIDDKLKYTKLGDLVRIVFKGKKKGKNAEYDDFEVYKSKE